LPMTVECLILCMRYQADPSAMAEAGTHEWKPPKVHVFLRGSSETGDCGSLGANVQPIGGGIVFVPGVSMHRLRGPVCDIGDCPPEVAGFVETPFRFL